MTLGLAMLVRDGSTVAERALASAIEHVDTATILYSGASSRDPLIGRLRRLARPKPLSVHARPFVEISAARTALLDAAAGRADWHLTIDDDHTIVVDDEISLPATAIGMVAERDGQLEHWMPRLLKDGRAWRWTGGAFHEYLDDGSPRAKVTGLQVIHHADGEQAAGKLEAIVAGLRAQIAADAGDARTVFYLAQGLADLGQWQEAIAWYRLRASLGGFAEEAWYARYCLGCLLTEHVGFEQGALELIGCWLERKQRAEPLAALATAALDIASRMSPPAEDVLFLRPADYGTPPADPEETP